VELALLIVALLILLGGLPVWPYSRTWGYRPVGLLLAVLLVVLLLPAWPYSASWGYGPSGGLFTVLIVVLLVLILTGRL
jgi:hypothetical protein